MCNKTSLVANYQCVITTYMSSTIKILDKFMISLHERRNSSQNIIYSAQSNIIELLSNNYKKQCNYESRDETFRTLNQRESMSCYLSHQELYLALGGSWYIVTSDIV